MDKPYTEQSNDALLQALRHAGRYPDLDLIEACVERGEALVPDLVDMLTSPDAEDLWFRSDPRWFQRPHAGYLLIEMGAPEAYPVFETILRDPEDQDFLEWFDKALHALGLPFVPHLFNVVQDASAPWYGVALSVSALRQLADEHPDEIRTDVLDVLRGLLPEMNEDGRLDVEGQVPYEDVERWTSVVLALAELHDEASREHIEQLYAADLVDEDMIGDVDAYRSILRGDEPPINDTFNLRGIFPDPHPNQKRRSPDFEGLQEDLLTELAKVGYSPHPGFIEDFVKLKDDITPKLLNALRQEVMRDNLPDEPQLYLRDHAGLLLIHFREEEALPLFMEDLRRASAERFSEDLEGKLHLYGPPAIPALIEVLHDESAEAWGRVEAASELSTIAGLYPETKDRVLNALRKVLPDAPDESSAQARVKDATTVWSNVIHELGRHQDEESRSHVKAMFAHDLTTPMYVSEDRYKKLMRGRARGTSFSESSFDVVDNYAKRYKEYQRRQKKRERQQRTVRTGGSTQGGTFTRDEPKVGRNDPCPCGSGLKYKHCCG